MTTAFIPLYVELIPRTAWFTNLRSELTTGEWRLVQMTAYRASDCNCEACGGRGPKHPVECHERWHFDLQTGVQTLIGVSALCPDCHEATHIGFARTQGRGEFAREWLMHVNGWSRSEVDRHVASAMAEWKVRSARQWKLDARWLLKHIPQISVVTRDKIMAHAAGISGLEPERDLVESVPSLIGLGSFLDQLIKPFRTLLQAPNGAVNRKGS